MSSNRRIASLCLLSCAAVAAVSFAADSPVVAGAPPADTVIATQGTTKLTFGDVDAFASRIEPNQRPGFFNSPKRLENLGRKDLANATLEGQPSVGMTAVGRLSRSLGPKVEQAVAIVAQLGQQEAAAVADFRVVHAELMAVVSQGKGLVEVVGKRFEATEMPRPTIFVELKSYAFGPVLV